MPEGRPVNAERPRFDSVVTSPSTPRGLAERIVEFR